MPDFDASSAQPVEAAAPAPTQGFDAASAQPYAPPLTGGRAAGLAARGFGAGLADLGNFANQASGMLGLPSLPDSSPNAPASTTPQLSDFVHPDKWRQAAEYFADKAHAPKPQTPGENVIAGAAEALPTAAVTGPAAFSAGRAAVGGLIVPTLQAANAWAKNNPVQSLLAMQFLQQHLPSVHDAIHTAGHVIEGAAE